jgi:hypothetical protein
MTLVVTARAFAFPWRKARHSPSRSCRAAAPTASQRAPSTRTLGACAQSQRETPAGAQTVRQGKGPKIAAPMAARTVRCRPLQAPSLGTARSTPSAAAIAPTATPERARASAAAAMDTAAMAGGATPLPAAARAVSPMPTARRPCATPDRENAPSPAPPMRIARTPSVTPHAACASIVWNRSLLPPTAIPSPRGPWDVSKTRIARNQRPLAGRRASAAPCARPIWIA